MADASALVDLIVRTPFAPGVAEVVRGTGTLQVPHVCDAEVASGLRKLLLTGRISEDLADTATGDYASLPIARHQQIGLIPRVLELRSNMSAYDALYVALAEKLDARLLTTDARLARAARAHTDLIVLP